MPDPLASPAPGRRRVDGRTCQTLKEVDALFGLGRHSEALAVVERALRQRGVGEDPDLQARLRLARLQALWSLGRSPVRCSEVARLASDGLPPLTRARIAEAAALFAWRAGELPAARLELPVAWEIYHRRGDAKGLCRVLEVEIGVLRDAGQAGEALEAQHRRRELAAASGRSELLAAALCDEGDLLASLGRWTEARDAAERGAALFQAAGDPAGSTRAGLPLANLALAAGDPAAARQWIDRALEQLGPEPNDVRTLAEARISLADLQLAVGDPCAAERAAAEATALFVAVGEASNQCRSRARRTQALVALGRHGEAVVEGRRAVRAAPGDRPYLQALGGLALGRALLARSPAAARTVFERALARCPAGSGLLQVARLGRALACGADASSEDVRLPLAGLEAWGDRRLLAMCLLALREICGVGVVLAPPRAAGTPRPSEAAAWLGAALVLTGEGEPGDRWAAALRAIRPVAPFHRAALVGETAWELSASGEGPRPLAGADLARDLASCADGPKAIDLHGPAGFEAHPTRRRYGLGSALLMPVADGWTLYLDRREQDAAFGDADLHWLEPLAELLGRTLPPTHRRDAAPAFAEIFGRSPVMEQLFAQMARVAGADVPVHLFGETGTGKEKVARALHRQSPRRGRPFVAVNASSLSDELFEAELFGHVRGAFTGAVADREGYVAAAEGGTLLIDEVADLSSRGQAKLLRFLTDGEYRRLGEAAPRRSNVRILTAANVDLRARVTAGRFREDLLFRLAGAFTLVVPPLRDRGDDLELLCRHFLEQAARRHQLTPPRLPSEVARALRSYAWPGNVRELESEMQRLVVLSAGGPIRRDHVSPHVAQASAAPGPSELRASQRAWERDHIRSVLERHRGNRTRAAHALGITRQGLLEKLRRLGL